MWNRAAGQCPGGVPTTLGAVPALGPQTQAGEDARGATSFHATVSRRAFNPNARASATSVKRDREGGPRASRAGIRGCVSGPTPRILEMRQRDFLKQCGL